MSEFHVEVVRIGPVEPHPNADTLSVTRIHGGYPVIVKTGEFREGDLAIYVPVDVLVPTDDQRWSFLGGKSRIKAKRLRGVFSMGLLTAAPDGVVEGQDMADALHIVKYEPPDIGGGDGQGADAPAPRHAPPVYTDIEGLRRHPDLLKRDEEVIVTEKLHGESMRAVHDGNQLHVGSRTRWKRCEAGTAWWRAAERAELSAGLARMPGVAVYGECHGYTGGFPYNTQKRATFRAFDVWRDGVYLDYDDAMGHLYNIGIPAVPVLYRGPWSYDVVAQYAEGCSTLDPSHVREGIVVRPVRERWDERVGRVILKLHGEGFLTR